MELKVMVGTLPVSVTFEYTSPCIIDFFRAFPSTDRTPTLTIAFVEQLHQLAESPVYNIVGARIQSDSLRFTDYAAPVGYVLTRAENQWCLRVSTHDTSRLGWRSRLQLWRPLSPFIWTPSNVP